MHPAFAGWWGHSHGPGAWFGGPRGFGGRCGPGGGRWGGGGGGDDLPPGGGDEGFGGGPFGVRRPLRFLAHRLELSEPQLVELATILDELKIERARAALDHRLSTSAFAEAFAAEKLDEARLDEIRADRVKSSERLHAAVTRALGKIHALLDAEQRKKLAYLLRTGALVI